MEKAIFQIPKPVFPFPRHFPVFAYRSQRVQRTLVYSASYARIITLYIEKHRSIDVRRSSSNKLGLLD